MPLWLSEAFPEGAVLPPWLSERGAVPLGTPVERADWLNVTLRLEVAVGSTGLMVPGTVPLGKSVKSVDWPNENE